MWKAALVSQYRVEVVEVVAAAAATAAAELLHF